MNGIVEIAIKYSNELPAWFGTVFGTFIAILLVLKVVMAILKIVRSTIFLESSKDLLGFFSFIVKNFFTGALSQLESPIERPKTKMIMKILSLINTYLAAVICFLFFAAMVVGMCVAGLPEKISSQLVILGISVFFMYMTVLFRSEADREYLAAKKYWREKIIGE